MRSPEPKEKLISTPMSKEEMERLKKRKRSNENDHMSDENEENRPISIKDIYDLITAKSAEDSNERKLIRDEIKSVIRSINEKIVAIEHNVNEIDKKFDAVTLLAEQNKKIINSLCQERIDKCMEIDGI